MPHPGRYLVGTSGQRDPEIFIWSFAWWPHAIAHLMNPFVTHEIYAPTGINLAWSTSVPALALAFSPLTELFGPSTSYDVAAIVLPALSAWTAYLLCVTLTRSRWASFVGGYLFGFSSFIVGHEFAGHLNLIAVFTLPLVARALVRYVRGELDGRGLAWRLGVLVGVELYISTEIVLTLTLALVVSWALALLILRADRPRLLAGIGPLAAGLALAGVIGAPLLYYAISDFVRQAIGTPSFFDADLLNLVVPTHLIAVGGSTAAKLAARFPGNDDERDSYLGLPALAIVAVFLVQRRRRPTTVLLACLFAVSVLCALGTSLHVAGHRLFALPWSLVTGFPGFDNVLPERFAVYTSLTVSVIVALWIARAGGRVFRRPYVLPLLAVAALLPVVWQSDFVQRPERWAFFTDKTYRVCIPRGETVAVFPFGKWGDSMLWQAESGFWFRIAEGNMGPDTLPESFMSDPTVAELTFQFINPNVRPSMAQLLQFAHTHHVDRFLSVQIHAFPSGTQMHAFGPVQLSGGVLVSPACGYTSLTGDRRQPG